VVSKKDDEEEGFKEVEIKYKYIYGPVSSWRLGSSLGIDLLSQNEKICNFNCIYCQLGKTQRYITERKVYVSVEKIINEIKSLPPDLEIDYYTFSGRGEPTLAKNFGEVVEALRRIKRSPIAVLTNSSLIDKEQVRDELAKVDFVALKLDAYSQNSLKKINQQAPGIQLSSIIEGISRFRKQFKGRLALQIMFIEENKDHIDEFINLVKRIKPDEVQINTPLRLSDVEPLSKDEITRIKERFDELDMDIVSVYEAKHKEVKPLSSEETLKRRGK